MSKSQFQNKSMSKYKIIEFLVFVMGLFLMTAFPVAASEKTQYEDVYINGYKLGFFEQLALEDHIDHDIPDGNYWFELDTGMWGPVGESAIGYIEVSEDYRDYIESKFFKQSQVTNIKLTASVEECNSGCLY